MEAVWGTIQKTEVYNKYDKFSIVVPFENYKMGQWPVTVFSTSQKFPTKFQINYMLHSYHYSASDCGWVRAL